jgi:probable F420-dependent oxidoreductase
MESEMKIGIVAFITEDTIDPAAVGRKCESLGFDAIFVGEHPCVPVKHHVPSNRIGSRATLQGDQLPDYYSHMVDRFVALMMAATATSRIKLGTGVCLISEREPIALAKTVATLDIYCKGRFIFGIGTGNVPEESAVMGVDFKTRWPVAREYIRAMKELWTKPEASFEGQYIKFPPIRSFPKPMQKPHPPIHIGAGGIGVGSLRSLKDTVAFGDGWGPVSLSPAELAADLATLRRLCDEAGRDFGKIEISVFIPIEYDEPRKTLEEYAGAGAHRLIFTLWPPALTEDGIESIAKKCLS